MKFSGVFIAPVTPISAEGQVDFEAFGGLVEGLLGSGIDGICLGGATSEFCRCRLEQRAELVRRVAQQLTKRTQLIVAIGACSYSESLELGNLAAEKGADAVLIPAPYFYPYSQEDLEHFFRLLAGNIRRPALLYNIPQFTTRLDAQTSIKLLKTEPNVIGIKDSSGDRRGLAQFTEAGLGGETSLIVGQDSLLYEALEIGWDGIVSGLGNLCPNLFLEFYEAFRSGNKSKALSHFSRIALLGSELEKLPVPWGIRAGLEVLGINCGPPALPLSSVRIEQIEGFKDWFTSWLKNDQKELVVN